jgi:hypothetical protein
MNGKELSVFFELKAGEKRRISRGRRDLAPGSV